ncbi:MAG: glucose-1-phosphate cytidylyltransferase [Verrucomicrobiota bacterium]|nr:glucose-1-phosphate cytidylyltransferase [Verrucomicrobiota bacterium]
MKVVILCGGKGTRLREETEYRPKPMVPIGGFPILWHIMKIYSHYGFKDFILCVGYKGQMIREYFRNYRWNTGDVTLRLGREPKIVFHDDHDEDDWTVTIAETGIDSLTATRIHSVKKYLNHKEPFLLTYGDGLSNIDLSALLESHYDSGKICTISAVHPAGRFGGISIGDNGFVSNFEEKPLKEKAYINGGFMVCDQKIFNYFSEANEMFEERPINEIVADSNLNAYCHEGWWCPMDTFRESVLLNELWNKKKAPWKVW